jgi:hypothetical protein
MLTAIHTTVTRHARRAVLVLVTGMLAACAHGEVMVRSAATGGEVARTLVSPSALQMNGGTFRPIGLHELATVPQAPVRTVASVASPRGEVWQGTYEGRTYGQRGAIALVLRTASDGALRGVVAWRVAPDARPGSSDPLALVRVPVVSSTQEAGQVVLTLDSYFDPACNCTARATFRGALRGDTLTGRFALEGAATVVGEERGRWRAVRVAP